MQGTLNRVKEGSKGTERVQGNIEQSPVRSPGNSEGCREHGTENGKEREQGTRNIDREREQRAAK